MDTNELETRSINGAGDEVWLSLGGVLRDEEYEDVDEDAPAMHRVTLWSLGYCIGFNLTDEAAAIKLYEGLKAVQEIDAD